MSIKIKVGTKGVFNGVECEVVELVDTISVIVGGNFNMDISLERVLHSNRILSFFGFKEWKIIRRYSYSEIQISNYDLEINNN